MNRWLALGLLAVSLGVVACEEQKPATDTKGAKPEGTTAAAVQIKDEDIPTQADFEDESAKDISPTTYKAEVDALEKEISAE